MEGMEGMYLQRIDPTGSGRSGGYHRQMYKFRVLSCVALAALAFSALPACAREVEERAVEEHAVEEHAVEQPTVEKSECAPRAVEGWLRLPPVSMPMLAGFGRIENPCAHPVAIVGVRSDAFAEVSLHESSIVDGISRMRAIPELEIAAGQSASLQPGSLHLMLMQPLRPLQAGERVEIQFLLEDGGTLRGQFKVRKP